MKNLPIRSMLLPAALLFGCLLAFPGLPSTRAWAQDAEKTPPAAVPALPEEDTNLEPLTEDRTTLSEVAAAKAIAEIERARRKKAMAIARTRVNRLASYDFKNMRGTSEEEVLKAAGVRALMNSAAQLYFSDHILIGRDLLVPYLQNYGEQFLSSRAVTDRRVMADGRVELDVRVGVNLESFYGDLEEKHFIGKPRMRPLMAVVLEEIVDGKPTTDGRGRKALEQSLRGMELRVESERMGEMSLAINAGKTSATLSAARNEAQRGEIEVLVTGTLQVNSRGKQEILYDEFAFYDASIQLQMIRVDTGEVLATASEGIAAPALAGETALDRTYQGLMPRCANSLAGNLAKDWERTMLDLGDYRLMITGINQEQLESVFNLLKTLSPSVRTYVKSFFGDVAVVNVYFPEAKPGQVEKFLRNSRIPQFQVTPADERRIELRVL